MKSLIPILFCLALMSGCASQNSPQVSEIGAFAGGAYTSQTGESYKGEVSNYIKFATKDKTDPKQVRVPSVVR